MKIKKMTALLMTAAMTVSLAAEYGNRFRNGGSRKHGRERSG